MNRKPLLEATDVAWREQLTHYVRLFKMTGIRATIAENIRREAKKQGIDIQDLAKAVGRSQLYDVLACRKGCTVDYLDKVASMLFISSMVLMKPVEA